MTTSYIDLDVNCSTCFNNIVEALRQTPGVTAVDGHASGGCLEVRHDIDEARLRDVVVRTGHSIEVGGNGEYVMGLVHANTEHQCGIST